jgi:hypothetical protein
MSKCLNKEMTLSQVDSLFQQQKERAYLFVTLCFRETSEWIEDQVNERLDRGLDFKGMYGVKDADCSCRS